MVLFRENVDLGARRLFPLADALVELFILLAADELCVDRDAIEFAGRSAACAATEQANTITPADTPESSLFMTFPPHVLTIPMAGIPHL